MAKQRITTDTEYWQLRDDYEHIIAQANDQEDKKTKKEYLKSTQDIKKVLEEYEKKKVKDTLALVKREVKISKIRNKTKADKKIFFNISPIESKYYKINELDETKRNQLSVKKESMLEMMKNGMYIKLKDDAGIYQVTHRDGYLDDMHYISTARYGDVPIQDIALIIERYYYESELSNTGHTVL